MPFPKLNIRFNKSFGSSPRETYIEDKNTGTCIPTTEECNKKLPSADKFEIQNQLKAGVTLNEVSTKILNTNTDINLPEFEKAIEKTIKKPRKNKTTDKE